MRISEVEVRCCRQPDLEIDSASLRASDTHYGMEFLVVTMKTDSGLEASSFGFAARSARGAGELAAASMRPFFTGRNALDREGAWRDFRTADRWWNHLPIYSYGPFDNVLWVLGALDAGQPLYQYIGGCRDEVPVYASSLVLPSPEAYAEEALGIKAKGYKAYKVHPPGQDYREDVEVHRAVRDAVGPDFTLMSDPVACFNVEQAVRFARELERLDYYWFEEPLADENLPGLKALTSQVDIPIVGGEVLAKHPYSLANYISDRVVDRVRADVSWTGGVTGVLKTARTAETFGMNCEIHTTIMHPLELVNLHCCGAIANNDYFELLTPESLFDFGLKKPLPIEDGMAKLPQEPGLGIEFDWDFIDNATYKKL